MSCGELRIDLRVLDTYANFLPLLRMMGFNLPPVNEVYFYVDNDNLAAFLDIIAFEIDDFLQQFTHQQIRNVAFPYYFSLFNGIKQTCAVLPNSSFLHFLDQALRFKNNGGAYNVNSKTFNKYATAEFADESSMRGGELDQAAKEAMNAKSDDDLIDQLRELQKGPPAAKEELQQYLAHLGSKPATHDRLSKIMRALGMASAPSSAAAAPASNARASASNVPAPQPRSTLAVPAAPIQFNIQNLQGTLSPYLAQGTTILQIQSGLDDLAKIAEDPKLGPAKAWNIARGLQKKGEIVSMGGGKATIKTKSGAEVTYTYRKILIDEEGADLRSEEEAIISAKEKFLLTKLGVKTFFDVLTSEFSNGGENVKRICKSFFEKFKPSFEEAGSFAESINMAIEEERTSKKKFVEKYSFRRNPANSQNYSKKENDAASVKAFDAAQRSLNSQAVNTSVRAKEEAAIAAAVYAARGSGVTPADADVIAKFIVSQLIGKPRAAVVNAAAEERIRKAILDDAKQAVQNMRLHATVLSTGVRFTNKQRAIFGGVVSVELLSAGKYLQWRGWDTYVRTSLFSAPTEAVATVATPEAKPKLKLVRGVKNGQFNVEPLGLDVDFCGKNKVPQIEDGVKVEYPTINVPEVKGTPAVDGSYTGIIPYTGWVAGTPAVAAVPAYKGPARDPAEAQRFGVLPIIRDQKSVTCAAAVCTAPGSGWDAERQQCVPKVCQVPGQVFQPDGMGGSCVKAPVKREFQAHGLGVPIASAALAGAAAGAQAGMLVGPLGAASGAVVGATGAALSANMIGRQFVSSSTAQCSSSNLEAWLEASCWNSAMEEAQDSLATSLGRRMAAGAALTGGIMQNAYAVLGIGGDFVAAGSLFTIGGLGYSATAAWDKEMNADLSAIKTIGITIEAMKKTQNKLEQLIEKVTFNYMIALFNEHVLPVLLKVKSDHTKEGEYDLESMLKILSEYIDKNEFKRIWAEKNLEAIYKESVIKREKFWNQKGGPRTAGQALLQNNNANNNNNSTTVNSAMLTLNVEDWMRLFLPFFINKYSINLASSSSSRFIPGQQKLITTNILATPEYKKIMKNIEKLGSKKNEKGEYTLAWFKTLQEKTAAIQGQSSKEIADQVEALKTGLWSIAQVTTAKKVEGTNAAAAAVATQVDPRITQLQQQLAAAQAQTAAAQASQAAAAQASAQAQAVAAQASAQAQAVAAQAQVEVQRQRNAADQAQRQRNAALQAQRQRNAEAQAQAEAQRQRNPAQPQAAANAQRQGNAAQAQAAAPAVPGNTLGGQIRNRETRRRRNGGKRKVNRKTRRSRRY